MRADRVTVAHRRQLAVLGVGKDRIRRAVRSGRWQEPVPGVVVLHSGALTRRERHLAALAWAGDDGRLSRVRLLRFPVRRLRREQSACGEEIWAALTRFVEREGRTIRAVALH
jgi:hypothetical protein